MAAKRGFQNVESRDVFGQRRKLPKMFRVGLYAPIDVITAKEILLTGKNDISDILYQLPQNFNNSIGQDFSGRTSGLTTAGGLTTADLARSRTESHAGADQRPALGCWRCQYRHLITRARPRPDPDFHGRTHRCGHRRRLGDLRLGRHCRRDQLHLEEDRVGGPVVPGKVVAERLQAWSSARPRSARRHLRPQRPASSPVTVLPTKSLPVLP